MKTITLILLCITLTTAAAWAKDYPVLDKDVHLAVREIFDGSAAERSPLYVLLLPDHNPVIFKTFDSKDMERVIRDCLAPGSVLYFNGTPGIVRPTDAQVLSLKDFCKSVGITLVL